MFRFSCKYSINSTALKTNRESNCIFILKKKRCGKILVCAVWKLKPFLDYKKLCNQKQK